jgi:hypothetical protein
MPCEHVASDTSTGGNSVAGENGAAAEVAALAATLATTMTVVSLKAMLTDNGQSIMGPKGDLVQRCAQGAIMGRIPACPLCVGGKLAYDAATGIYTCGGYMDDAHFRACSFRSASVARGSWAM